jgi:hypothetical protein
LSLTEFNKIKENKMTLQYAHYGYRTSTRWISGNRSETSFQVPAALSVKVGEQLFVNGKFYGIAMQCSPSGNSWPIRVATAGIFWIDGVEVDIATL